MGVEEDMKAMEEANVKLVTEFCKLWEDGDVEKLVPYLHEDLYYEIWEDGGEINGPEEFRQTMGPFLDGMKKIEWEIFRTEAMGKVVINERHDHFYRKGDDPEDKDWHFPVVGVFVIKDGKIAIWHDYTIPGKPVIM